jgi:hypothetical protein
MPVGYRTAVHKHVVLLPLHLSIVGDGGAHHYLQVIETRRNNDESTQEQHLPDTKAPQR